MQTLGRRVWQHPQCDEDSDLRRVRLRGQLLGAIFDGSARRRIHRGHRQSGEERKRDESSCAEAPWRGVVSRGHSHGKRSGNSTSRLSSATQTVVALRTVRASSKEGCSGSCFHSCFWQWQALGFCRCSIVERIVMRRLLIALILSVPLTATAATIRRSSLPTSVSTTSSFFRASTTAGARGP